jgi:hypothetical protein
MVGKDILFVAIGNAALGQIIGRHFNKHFITGKHTNAVFAHAASGVGNNLVLVFELNAKRRVGQEFGDDTGKLQNFFFCHAVPVCTAGDKGPFTLAGTRPCADLYAYVPGDVAEKQQQVKAWRQLMRGLLL